METEEARTTMGGTETGTPGAGLEEQARRKVQSLKEEAVDRGRKYLEVQKGTAAEYMKDFADAMETAAAQLEGMHRRATSHYIRTASRELQRWSSSLRDYGVDSIARQLQTFAGRHPGMVLGGAAVAGFAVTRILRSAEREFRGVGPEAAPAEETYPPPQGEFRRSAAEEFGPHS